MSFRGPSGQRNLQFPPQNNCRFLTAKAVRNDKWLGLLMVPMTGWLGELHLPRKQCTICPRCSACCGGQNLRHFPPLASIVLAVEIYWTASTSPRTGRFLTGSVTNRSEPAGAAEIAFNIPVSE